MEIPEMEEKDSVDFHWSHSSPPTSSSAGAKPCGPAPKERFPSTATRGELSRPPFWAEAAGTAKEALSFVQFSSAKKPFFVNRMEMMLWCRPASEAKNLKASVPGTMATSVPAKEARVDLVREKTMHLPLSPALLC